MFGNSAIGLSDLAQFCRRLSISLEAGVDLRKVLAREAGGRSRRSAIERFETLRLEVNRGRGLSDALERTGDFFPPLFHEMVGVGEETGKLPEVLHHLAEHYELQLRLRRNFLASITWPMTQLIAAILIIGLVIWLLGIIGGVTGQAVDIFGFGLVGNRGAAVYFGTVGAIALGIAMAARAALRGQLWVRPLQQFALSNARARPLAANAGAIPPGLVAASDARRGHGLAPGGPPRPPQLAPSPVRRDQ